MSDHVYCCVDCRVSLKKLVKRHINQLLNNFITHGKVCVKTPYFKSFKYDLPSCAIADDAVFRRRET